MPAPESGAEKSRKAPDPASVLLAIGSVLYPLLALIAIRTIGATAVVALLCLLIFARAALGARKGPPTLITAALLAVAGAMTAISFVNQHLALLLYPVFMNAAMLAAFAISLARPPSMIERFARLAEPDLPESGVRYTRNLTIVWCVFFVANGAIALATALIGDWSLWTLYNGVIAYVLMGILGGGELLLRKRLRGAQISQ